MTGSEEQAAFAIHGEHRDGVVRLIASGELDISTAPLLEGWLAAVAALQPTTILVDFASLRFMDSTGLKALLQAHQQATGSGRVLVVLNGSQEVRRVFELTRTDHLLQSSVSSGILDPPTSEEDGEWLPITMPGAESGRLAD